MVDEKAEELVLIVVMDGDYIYDTIRFLKQHNGLLGLVFVEVSNSSVV